MPNEFGSRFRGPRTINGWQLAAGQGTVTSYNVYQCKICGKSYIWKSSYHRHVREECGGNRQLATCKNCGRQYRWRDSLIKHLKYECGVEPRYTCSMCGRKFRHKQVLTSHFKRVHK
nr:zinc finger protein 684-like [Megalopta genalis]